MNYEVKLRPYALDLSRLYPSEVIQFFKRKNMKTHQLANRPRQHALIDLRVNQFQQEKRELLVQETLESGRGGLKRAARRHGINQQTAKAIMRKYRRQGVLYEPASLKKQREQAQASAIHAQQNNRSSERAEGLQGNRRFEEDKQSSPSQESPLQSAFVGWMMPWSQDSTVNSAVYLTYFTIPVPSHLTIMSTVQLNQGLIGEPQSD